MFYVFFWWRVLVLSLPYSPRRRRSSFGGRPATRALLVLDGPPGGVPSSSGLGDQSRRDNSAGARVEASNTVDQRIGEWSYLSKHSAVFRDSDFDRPISKVFVLRRFRTIFRTAFPPKARPRPQQASRLAEAFTVLRKGALLLDEVDLLLHPLKSELHWPLGVKVPPSNPPSASLMTLI